MKNNFINQLIIEQDYISIFASGNSLDLLNEEDIEYIKKRSFLITMNYAPIKYLGHMNMWSDKKVSDFLTSHWKDKDKNQIFLARDKAFYRPHQPNIYNKVDYWFNEKNEILKGNYTIVWLLQILQKYWPDKKKLIFGLDMKTENNDQAKWYDKYTSFDRDKRGKNYQVNKKLTQCADQIKKFCTDNNFYNCNLDSGFDYFEKIDWKLKLNEEKV